VERFNQTLQRALLKLVQKEHNNWDEYLDVVLFAYRTSKQKSSQATPFEIMYCRFAIKCVALHITTPCYSVVYSTQESSASTGT